MSKKIKHNFLHTILFLALFLIMFNVNALSTAAVKNNQGITLSPNNSYLNVKIMGTRLSAHDGYAMDLQMTNTYSKPILVSIIPTKINGKTITFGSLDEDMFKYTNGIDGDSDLYHARVNNGASNAVTRTAYLGQELIGRMDISKINTLEGYLSVTDLDGKVLLSESTGKFNVVLEDNGANEKTPDSNGSGFWIGHKNAYSGNDDACVSYLGDKEVDFTLYSSSKINDDDVVWSSSDPSVAVIDADGHSSKKGMAGTTIIKAEYKGKATVIIYEVKNPELIIDNRVLFEGVASNLIYEVVPDTDNYKKITYAVKDSSILTITNGGRINPIKAGTTEVTATYMRGNTPIVATTYLRVEPLRDFSLNKDLIVFAKNANTGKYVTAEGDAFESIWADINLRTGNYYTDSDFSSKYFNWEIGDTSIASGEMTEHGFRIFPKKAGDTKLKVSYKKDAGIYKTIPIHVTDNADYDYVPLVPVYSNTPTLTTKSGPLTVQDTYEVTLKHGGMDTTGYKLNYAVKNKSTSAKRITMEITSINGLKFHTSGRQGGYGHKLIQKSYVAAGSTVTSDMVITPEIFSQLGNVIINEIRGYIQDETGNKNEFAITPGSARSTSYVRKTPSGKELMINFVDIGMEITGIVDKKTSANINFLISNKSAVNSYYVEGGIEEINGRKLSENIIFITGEDGQLYRGEKMYGRFTIPESEYMKSGRRIDSLKVNVTVRNSGKTVVNDQTIELKSLSSLSTKEETLEISDVGTLYVGEATEKLKVYDTNRSIPIMNSRLTFESSDIGVFYVDCDGTIIPSGPGSALLTVSDGARMGNKMITVKPSTLRLNDFSSSPMIENTYLSSVYMVRLHPDIREEYSKIHFTSSDESIVKIDGKGNFIALKPGTVTITASYQTPYNQTLTDTKTLSVVKIPRLVLSSDSMSFTDDSTGVFRPGTLSVGYTSGTRTLYKVEWTCSNPAVVAIKSYSNGTGDPEGYNGRVEIQPLAEGTATVTAKYAGLTKSCEITVTRRPANNSENKGGNGDQGDRGGKNKQDNRDGKNNQSDKGGNNNQNEKAADNTESTPSDNTSTAPGNAFTDPVTGYTYVITGDGVRLESVGQNASNVVIPDYVTINGKSYPVTSISKNAFRNNKTVKSVVVGKNIKTIESGTFQGATSLTTVDLKSSGVTKIGKNAFRGCNCLKTVKVNANTLKSVAKGAFKTSNGSRKVKVTVFAKDKKTYNKCVKKLISAGLKNANFKYKKKKNKSKM